MIQDAVRQAKKMHRKMVESAYDGSCCIYETMPVKDPQTKVTSNKKVILVENQPCRLSFSSSPPVAGGETSTAVSQVIKLFLAPEIEIKPGSRIEVTQQGRTELYKQSGKPAVYASHQEIILTLWEEYA